MTNKPNSGTVSVSHVGSVGKYDEVLKPFMGMMEKELHANSGKGDRPGWLSMSADTCMLEIYYHLGKLQKAVKDGNGDGICEFAADVANLSMMLTDICGALNLFAAAQPADQQGEPVCDEAERLANEAAYYRSTLRNVLKDIRDDLARGGMAPSWSGVAETLSIVLSNDHAPAQPATAKVVLPERMPGISHTDSYEEGWNACLDEVAKLNGATKVDEPLADLCENCDRLTYSPTDDAKWCCFCGARLTGEVAKLNGGSQ